MNLPASSAGNWSWRFRQGDLTSELAEKLKNLSSIYGRDLPVESGKDEEIRVANRRKMSDNLQIIVCSTVTILSKPTTN